MYHQYTIHNDKFRIFNNKKHHPVLMINKCHFSFRNNLNHLLFRVSIENLRLFFIAWNIPALLSVSISVDSLLFWLESRGIDVDVEGGGLVSIDSELPLVSAGLLTKDSLTSIDPWCGLHTLISRYMQDTMKIRFNFQLFSNETTSVNLISRDFFGKTFNEKLYKNFSSTEVIKSSKIFQE